MKKSFVLGCAMAAAFCAPSFATDLPQRAPAPVYKAAAPLFDWNGFYIGANAGYGWGDTNRVIPAIDAVNVPFLGQDPSVSLNGAVYGGHLGFNWVANSSWLFGLEGSFDGVDANKTVTAIAGPTNSVATKMNWLATVTPRIGYVNANWLTYVKGGYAAGEFKTYSNAANITFASANSTADGWTAGVGIEYGITQNWIFGVEYNYYNMQRKSMNGTYTAGQAFSQSIAPEFSTVLARLSYKFGR